MTGRDGACIRVLVLATDPAAARRLAHEVGRGNGYPCSARSGVYQGAAARVRRHRPHLVLCSIGSDDALPTGAIRTLKQSLPGVRILVVGESGEAAPILRALRQGADGFVLRGDPGMSLHEAVRRVLEDDPPLSRGVVQRILEHLREGTDAGNVPEQSLSRRQRQVADLLSEGWTNKEIAIRLEISADAVKQHVAAVKRKLKVRSRTQIAGWLGRGGVRSQPGGDPGHGR